MKTDTKPAPVADTAATATPLPEPTPVIAPATEAESDTPEPVRLKLVSSDFDTATVSKLIADAKAMVGRIPLLPGEETRKHGTKGVTVRRLDAYDWNRLNPDVIPVAKRAVRRLLAAQALEQALKA